MYGAGASSNKRLLLHMHNKRPVANTVLTPKALNSEALFFFTMLFAFAKVYKELAGGGGEEASASQLDPVAEALQRAGLLRHASRLKRAGHTQASLAKLGTADDEEWLESQPGFHTAGRQNISHPALHLVKRGFTPTRLSI